MSTPIQALERAMRDGANATEVLASLGSQGFILVNQEALTEAAIQVFRFMDGVSNPEATGKTVITAAVAGSLVMGMMSGD